MGLFQQGINLVKGFFSTEDEQDEVKSIKVLPTAKVPVAKVITPTKKTPIAKSMNFPVGEGLSNVTRVLPGPRISTLEAIKRGEKIEPATPTAPPKISETTVAKTIVGKQPIKTLAESSKDIAGGVAKGGIEFIKKQFTDDLARSPLERVKYNTSLPYKVGKEVLKILPMIPGFAFRWGAAAGLDVAGGGQEIAIPKNLQFALGENPIKSIGDVIGKGEKQLIGMGATPEQARNIAVMGTAASIWADIFSGGGNKALKKKIEEEIIGTVKDKVTREFIITEAERIAKLPRKDVQREINTVIANIIDDGSDAFQVTKEARIITDAEHAAEKVPTWYRGGGEGETIRGKTAQDIVDYEVKDLGNDITIEPGVNLSDIKSENVKWLTTTKNAAKEYGKVDKVAGDFKIIARDNYGGVLVDVVNEPTPKRIQFVSPNVKENLTFEQATKNLETPEYKQNYEAVKQTYENDGLIGELKTGRGDWSDGAEETFIKIVTNDTPDDKAIYSLSKNARSLEQKDAIDFKLDNAGLDELYIIDPNGKSVEDVRNILDSKGIKYKTLGDDKLYVINSGEYFDKKMVDTMSKIEYDNSLKIDPYNGKATFVTGVDDRVKARGIYDDIINSYEKKYGVEQTNGNQADSILRQSVSKEADEAGVETAGKRIGSIGLEKFEVDDQTKIGLTKLFKDSGLETKVPQTEKQWLEAAKESDVMQKAITPDEVERANGVLLKTEQRIATISVELQQTADPAKRGALFREAIELSRNLNDELSARGRLLRAAKTGVSEEDTIIDKIIKAIGKNGDDLDEMTRRAGEVDFNDQKAVVKLYREFVKPKFTEILTEYRYNNMLSNPRTQARNIFSNVVQAILTRPLVKFVTAGIDTFSSLLTGEQREVFFKEVPKYYYGLAKSIPAAFDEFIATLRGQRAIGQQDIKAALNNIPTGRLPGFFTIPSRTLEAVDRMMQTLIVGGEMAAGKTAKEAGKIAEYSLFRSGLDIANKTGQGALLSSIDNLTSKIDFLRKYPLVGWFVPFLRTPMNFAKMWLEYSPAGLFTMIGSQRKKEQLAKALIGSAITAYGAQLAFADKTTWNVPRDAEAKALFYASGKKPFSVKIGDNWVPMMYLGPWAFALALPAAIKYHYEDDPAALTDSAMAKLGKDLSALAYFYSQQTFMAGLGSFVELGLDNPDVSVSKNLAFTAGQVIPFQGLVRYISTIVDPVYRKSNTFLEAIESGLPYMSKDLEPHTLPTGEVSKRNIWSYLAPYDITKEKVEYDRMLKIRNQELQSNNLRNQADKKTQNQAAKIVQTLFTAKSDQEIIDALTPMKDNPALKSTVKNMIKKQAGYQAGLVQPYMILEPADRAELIHTKTVMMMSGGKKEEQELIEMLESFKEANLWGEKERKALKALMKEYPIK